MELLLDILANPLVQAIIKIIVIVLMFVMLLGTVLTLMERKWMSAVQDRLGPNRAYFPWFGNKKITAHGAFQLAADGLKSIFKEDTIPVQSGQRSKQSTSLPPSLSISTLPPAPPKPVLNTRLS